MRSPYALLVIVPIVVVILAFMGVMIYLHGPVPQDIVVPTLLAAPNDGDSNNNMLAVRKDGSGNGKTPTCDRVINVYADASATMGMIRQRMPACAQRISITYQNQYRRLFIVNATMQEQAPATMHYTFKSHETLQQALSSMMAQEALLKPRPPMVTRTIAVR
jgi:hypothetical protein